MFSLESGGTVSSVQTIVTSGRGMNASEITELALNKLLQVADTAPPAIREQAIAFKDQMRVVINYYVEQAQRSERTTVSNILEQAGQRDAAELLRKL